MALPRQRRMQTNVLGDVIAPHVAKLRRSKRLSSQDDSEDDDDKPLRTPPKLAKVQKVQKEAGGKGWFLENSKLCTMPGHKFNVQEIHQQLFAEGFV